MMSEFEELAKMSDRINEDTIKWLNAHGYFDAPASKGHHLAIPGGLMKHSVCVAQQLVNLTKRLELFWCREDSPVVIGLFHDLCKMDAYIPKFDKPIEVTYLDGELVNSAEELHIVGYDWNNYQAINGHGDKSVMLLSQIMKLTEEEVMCIRYHMGAFSDDDKQRSAYSNAVRNFSNVLWTHTADMVASQVLNT